MAQHEEELDTHNRNCFLVGLWMGLGSIRILEVTIAEKTSCKAPSQNRKSSLHIMLGEPVAKPTGSSFATDKTNSMDPEIGV